MYLICSASDGIDGPGHDLAMKGSLAELAGSPSGSRSHGRSLAVPDCVERPGAPFYPGVLVIEFGSYVNLRRRNLHLRWRLSPPGGAPENFPPHRPHPRRPRHLHHPRRPRRPRVPLEGWFPLLYHFDFGQSLRQGFSC